MAARKRAARAIPTGPVTIRYELAELPSSQHRAGLAGLVLAVRYLSRLGAKGICRVDDVSPAGATFVADLEGMKALFDLVYAAAAGEAPSPSIRKDRNGNPVPPARSEETREVHAKTGRESVKVTHFYPMVIPRLEVARDLDPTSSGPDHEGLWSKLLRDMVWSILRGIPKTREPFDARSEGRATDDATKAMAQLANADSAVELPSTYYLGAQAKSAENVPFRDKARAQFLLHFWPLVAGVYAPEIEKRDGVERPGFAVVVPDVADLEAFTEELPFALKQRSTEAAAFRPRDAVVSLPEEAGLAALALLWARLARAEARRGTADLVTAVDVILADKERNSIKLLAVSRIDPVDSMIDEYATLRRELWDPLFRARVVSNLLHQRPWWSGFNRLFATIDANRVLPGGDEAQRKRARAFAHDVRIKLGTDGKETEMSDLDKQPKTLEELLLQIVSVYLARKLKGKGLEWDAAKGDPGREREYRDTRADLARSAFLQVRSRTSADDFREYFAGTLCSTGQPMNDESFQTLTRALKTQPEDVRTLTLLALSAKA